MKHAYEALNLVFSLAFVAGMSALAVAVGKAFQ
ncbi:hypothetical protein Astex_0313 [Asticcacaulis excentricus CB 48]|uniref:Uncharacterized protein n=1 Tax=Asticcacaulis excentricus (strain ATCC 15261 / DSM 4724 / KCTC 12464 / NCIMB 9791 / VKM B-1370 / CB 48) TaxID=573065 RepID=E8RPN4_ASTEC|nr:hypothetical protein Astex_0313 [Asticcacaulis excentricus CB 48]